MRNLIQGIVSGVIAIIPSVVTIDPELISEGLTTLAQVVLGIISLVQIIKAIIKHKQWKN